MLNISTNKSKIDKINFFHNRENIIWGQYRFFSKKTLMVSPGIFRFNLKKEFSPNGIFHKFHEAFCSSLQTSWTYILVILAELLNLEYVEKFENFSFFFKLQSCVSQVIRVGYSQLSRVLLKIDQINQKISFAGGKTIQIFVY